MEKLYKNTKSTSIKNPIQVMLVDDSAVIRGFLTRFIESDPGIKVTASVSNGQIAINNIKRTSFDVIVLDIEMPVMDGMTALPLLLKEDPCVQVVIASTLTKENAVITLKALHAGAAECLAKPTAKEMSESTIFRDSLVEKIKALGQLARRKRGKVLSTPTTKKTEDTISSDKVSLPAKKFSLRPEIIKIMPDVITIGSSTGGPQALLQFFVELKDNVKQPIFVTQHMPPTFTTILAEHISKHSGLKCAEATEGDIVQNGHIYLAPGNFHMTVKKSDGKKVISLNQNAPENFCRPAVDPMLKSIVDTYGKKILTIIFTGMGSDGLEGCKQVVNAGGVVLAQDETTSVVWGMPGAVAREGICTQVLPLGLMAKAVREYADCRRPF